MRLLNSAICATVVAGLLAGCAGSSSNAVLPGAGAMARTAPISVYDDAAPPHALTVLHSLVLPDKAKRLPQVGIYVSLFYGSSIFGYPANNKKNEMPICTVPGVTSPNGIAVDGAGNLIDPDGGTATILIFGGPRMCGKQVGSISDSYGQPSDASSADATKDKIAVANIVDTGSAPGSVSVCTLAKGCTVNLTNGSMYHSGGVAMSNSGDCWDDAKTTSTGGAALIYFKKCAGKGELATGFKSTSYGNIEIDNKGHLVIIDELAMTVTIYGGCTPKCTVLGGPFNLKAESFFGKLNKANTDYAAVDRTDGVVDVYQFTEKAMKYEYSFSAGLSTAGKPEGIAQLPRSPQ